MEEFCHHVDDLFLCCLSVSRNGLFHLKRRSLNQHKVVLCRSEKYDPTCLSDRYGGRNIAIEEELFHAHCIGAIFLDEFIKHCMDF